MARTDLKVQCVSLKEVGGVWVWNPLVFLQIRRSIFIFKIHQVGLIKAPIGLVLARGPHV